jgi:VanZ family protein
MMMPMTERRPRIALLVWPLTAAYWLGIFYLTHLPPQRLPKTRISDVHAHFTAYAVLALLLLWSLHYTELSPRAAAWWVVGLCFFYGAIDEVLQIPVGRICSMKDWIADASGTVTVVAIAVIIGAARHVRRA